MVVSVQTNPEVDRISSKQKNTVQIFVLEEFPEELIFYEHLQEANFPTG